VARSLLSVIGGVGAGGPRCGCSCCQGPDLDQVVGEHAVTAPGSCSVDAGEFGAVASVAAFDVVDPAFGSGAPLDHRAERASVLELEAGGAGFGLAQRNSAIARGSRPTPDRLTSDTRVPNRCGLFMNVRILRSSLFACPQGGRRRLRHVGLSFKARRSPRVNALDGGADAGQLGEEGGPFEGGRGAGRVLCSVAWRREATGD
jgi:hypothetical protein